MKDRLISEALRFLIFIWPFLVTVSWTFAIPYALLDHDQRREHFTTMRELMSRESWAEWWAEVTKRTLTL